MANRINSNVTFTAYAWEQVQGLEPPVGDYRTLDLNTYSDAGASYENTTRAVMTGDRQLLKGAQTSKEASFGYNIDNTILNTLPQVAAFMFNKPKEQPNTRSIVAGSVFNPSYGGTITSFDGSVIVVSAGGAVFKAGDLVVIEDGINNRVPLQVSAATATEINVTKLNADDAIAPLGTVADRRVTKVGFIAGGAVTLASTAASATLTLAAGSWLDQGIVAGEWIFVGGDDAASRFAATDAFYARVSAVTATVLTLDNTTRALPSNDTCAALQVFVGTMCVNGKTMATATHSRYLGVDPDGKHMREVMTGCMANEMAINTNEKSFVTQDFTYIAMDALYPLLTDVEEAAILARTLPPVNSEVINTSTDVVRQRMAVYKVASMNTAEIHSFVQELNLSVTNNLTEDTAQGHIGNVGTTAGDFTVTGTATLYFNSTAALNAIRCNCTVGLDMIFARKNSGLVIDMPELSLSGDGVQVEKGSSIKLALDQNAFKNRFGFTMSYTAFHYLPDVAMPSQGTCDC